RLSEFSAYFRPGGRPTHLWHHYGAEIVSGSAPIDQPLARRTEFWRRTGSRTFTPAGMKVPPRRPGPRRSEHPLPVTYSGGRGSPALEAAPPRLACIVPRRLPIRTGGVRPRTGSAGYRGPVPSRAPTS